MKVHIIGGTNQVAACLVPRLLASGSDVAVSSRTSQPPWIAPDSKLSWNTEIAQGYDATIVIAPLSVVAPQLVDAGHVVAFSSMSVVTKASSRARADRELVTRLVKGEDAIRRAARDRCTILRPTMIYGCGLDRNLSRIAALIRRFRRFPLCGHGRGLRQPVLAQDLAALVERIVRRPLPGTFSAGGGEVLTYKEMIMRVFASLDMSPRWLHLPPSPVKATAAVCEALGANGASAGLAILSRMQSDLDVDDRATVRAFDYRPRPFTPGAAMWDPPHAPLVSWR